MVGGDEILRQMYTTPVGRSGTKLGFNYSANSVLLGKVVGGDSATTDKTASLRSDVTDFAGLVNLAGVDSGLTGDSKLIPDTVKGDIVLMAWVDEVNGTDGKFPNNNAAEIAELNSDKDKSVSFKSFTADAGTGGGTIKITGAYSGTKVHAEVEDSGQTVKVQLTPKADIEINGNVISEEGIIKITSAANNIIIQSGYAKYELIINADMQNTINQMQQNWQKQGGPALSDAVDTFGIAYRIV